MTSAMNSAMNSAPPLLVNAWGRLRQVLHPAQRLTDRHAVLPMPSGAGRAPAGGSAAGMTLPFGNGRSYGDVCLNSGGALWLTRGLDRFISFDKQTGVLTCEAGVLLDDIIHTLLPQGWFLPVTPGTRFVTLGGAIANDVHGKNHHRAGTLGEHVLALTLLRSDGSCFECSAAQDAPWLIATIGGLGLTGLIVSAQLQMRRVPGPWIDVETSAFWSLAEFFNLSLAAEARAEYSVAWIDCVNGRPGSTRGVFFNGNHAAATEAAAPARPRTVPLTPPVSLVNGLSLRALNQAYFWRQRLRSTRSTQALLPFFYPLDGLLGWNKLYGPRGFYQYQCVVPRANQVDATAALLAAIRADGQGSFLAVLKTFGERPSAGLLSFPMAGTTLALDFPNRGVSTEQLFERLDAIVGQAGGRVYMAKDARMSRKLFRAGYPGLEAFARFRDPAISSDLSRRLLDD